VRASLKAIVGESGRFRGVFECYGTIGNSAYATFMLKNVSRVNNDEILTNHLWLVNTRDWDRFFFIKGDVIEFNAKVTTYKKKNQKQNYELSSPYNIKLIPKSSLLQQEK
jgi:hypothetical protein